MRTTVTVDHLSMQQTGQSFKVTLNQAIRKGLAGTVLVVEEEPFVVASQTMGLRPGIDPTQLQQMGDEMEVDAFLDLTRSALTPSRGASEKAP